MTHLDRALVDRQIETALDQYHRENLFDRHHVRAWIDNEMSDFLWEGVWWSAGWRILQQLQDHEPWSP